jgi:hypothetical protein
MTLGSSHVVRIGARRLHGRILNNSSRTGVITTYDVRESTSNNIILADRIKIDEVNNENDKTIRR